MRVTASALLLALFAASPAFAAPPEGDHAAAVESFRRGTQLVEAGKLQDAVDAFRDALHREPASVGARLDLADCYEKIGSPASAWREYVVATEYARKVGDARETLARSSAGGLEARLFLVRLVGASSSTELHVDGDPVPAEIILRASVALAPGHHRLELTEPGKKPVSLELAGVAGETRPLRISFESEAAAPEPGAASSSSSSSQQRTWGFVLGGVGLVGVGVGAVFGGLALGKRSTLDAEAHDPSVGAARFYSDRSSADTVAAVSTVGFIAGGVALAAGIVLVAMAPGKRSTGWIRVGPNVGSGTGLAAGGEF